MVEVIVAAVRQFMRRVNWGEIFETVNGIAFLIGLVVIVAIVVAALV